MIEEIPLLIFSVKSSLNSRAWSMKETTRLLEVRCSSARSFYASSHYRRSDVVEFPLPLLVEAHLEIEQKREHGMKYRVCRTSSMLT